MIWPKRRALKRKFAPAHTCVVSPHFDKHWHGLHMLIFRTSGGSWHWLRYASKAALLVCRPGCPFISIVSFLASAAHPLSTSVTSSEIFIYIHNALPFLLCPVISFSSAPSSLLYFLHSFCSLLHIRIGFPQPLPAYFKAISVLHAVLENVSCTAVLHSPI